jgi:GNAT superfamily N-acetyltransferase
VIVDPRLIGRVNRAILHERSTFAEGMAAAVPGCGARWQRIGGGRAVYTGPGGFSNRALGLGIHEALTVKELQDIEAFYKESRNAGTVQLELSSVAKRDSLQPLAERGYQPIRFRNIYAMGLPRRWTQHPSDAGPTGPPDVPNIMPDIMVVRPDQASEAAWSDALLEGFGYHDPQARGRVAQWNRMLVRCPGVTALMAAPSDERAVAAVGGASVMLRDGVAVLGGAATLPAQRRRGVQQALIEARLRLAEAAECELAVVTADPGGTSARNAERAGFRLVYTHLVFGRPPGS